MASSEDALKGLRGLPRPEDFYSLVTSIGGSNGIKCLVCDMTSWSEGDVKNRYCAKCDMYHVDRVMLGATRQVWEEPTVEQEVAPVDLDQLDWLDDIVDEIDVPEPGPEVKVTFNKVRDPSAKRVDEPSMWGRLLNLFRPEES